MIFHLLNFEFIKRSEDPKIWIRTFEESHTWTKRFSQVVQLWSLHDVKYKRKSQLIDLMLRWSYNYSFTENYYKCNLKHLLFMYNYNFIWFCIRWCLTYGTLFNTDVCVRIYMIKDMILISEIFKVVRF